MGEDMSKKTRGTERRGASPAPGAPVSYARRILPLGAMSRPTRRCASRGRSVIRLLAEELSVGRRRVETGRLRVRRVTRECLEDVDEELRLDEPEVERVPVGTIVEARPPVRETEDEIIIPVVEEVVVVERRLMLKEEIHVRKTRRIEHHREQVRLRAQEVEILRLPPERHPPRTDRRGRGAGRRADAIRGSAPAGAASSTGAIR